MHKVHKVSTAHTRKCIAMHVAGTGKLPITVSRSHLNLSPRRVVGRTPMTTLAFFSAFGSSTKTKREEKKQELLQYLKPLQRGLKANQEDAEVIEQLCQDLERINPNKASLASPLINGRWELQYTTSASILGRSKPPFLRPIGPIYQYIDAQELRARNQETAPLFNQVC